MKHLRVYLGGPIEGLTYEQAVDWRTRCIFEFRSYSNVSFYDPMSGKQHLIGTGPITSGSSKVKNHFTSKNDSVFYRDVTEVRRCDILLVNLSHLNGGSTGTFFEMGFAYGLGKLIIVVGAGKKAEHPFIQVPAILVCSLDEAFELIKGLA